MATKKTQGENTGATKKSVAARKSQIAIPPTKDSGDPVQHLIVRGTVSYPDKSPAIGLTVTAFDKDVGGENLLGNATVDAKGNYHITYSAAQFRRSSNESRGADVFVRIHDVNNVLRFQSKTVVNAPADLLLNVQLPAKTFVVRGQVRLADGTPLAGALVRAYDKDLRKQQLLGTATTDPTGHYEIPFRREKFVRAERGTADLIVRVFRNKPTGKPLAESQLRMNVGADATVDFTVPVPVVSEWVRIRDVVLPLLEGQGKGDQPLPPSQLNEADIGFIVGETGLDRELVRLWVLAAKTAQDQALIVPTPSSSISMRTNVSITPASATIDDVVEWQIFYGWYREGQPQQFSDLIRRSTDALMASTERAIVQTYIPAVDQSLQDRLRHALDGRRIDKALRPAKEGEAASLGDALGMIPGAHRLALDSPDGPGRRLAALVVAATPENGPPWQKIREVVGDDDLFGSVQRSFGLMTLTRGHVPLMRALQHNEVGATAASLADLVANDSKDWIELARQYGAPKEIEAATDKARYILYGRHMARTVELMHPTPFIQHRIAADRIPLAGDLKEPILAFLSANPALRFKETPILVFLASGKVISGGLTEEKIKAITPELLKLERVARLAPSLEYVGPMLSSGYESGHDVVRRHSREVFVREIRHAISDEADAGQLYDVAAGVVATTEALVLMYSPIFSGRDLPVLPSLNSQKSTISLASTKTSGTETSILPANLQQLFGNQDYCECAHGASLYGAAAYLADLLQMLARGGKDKESKKTALQVLLDRRPDLAEIDLTGNNTDITQPYIDLVLEVLEAPDWESGNPPNDYTVIRNNVFDNSLDLGEVPSALADALAKDCGLALSESRTAGRTTDAPGSAGAAFKSWLIRDQQSGLKLQLIGIASDKYGVRVHPQSVAGMSNGYRPWSSQLSQVVRQVAASRFPWSLPFDIVRDEANSWLEYLGATREEVMLAFAGVNRWTNIDAACERLNISRATRDVLSTAPSPTNPDYQDWGFTSTLTGSEGIYDPIAGAQGTLNAGEIKWEGGDARPPDPLFWFMLLKNVSLLRSRAGLTHRELLNVLETGFVRDGGARLDITGKECNTGLMRLEAMDASLARRIHLFVRLWRRLGWSTTDLDRAIKAHATSTSGANQNVAFTKPFLLFVANVVRLHARSPVPVATLLDLFGAPTLDTTFYWDHSGPQPVRTLSRYEFWFDNPTLGKPRLAEFRLNDARDDLSPAVVPKTGLPKVRISDHLTYVAAALALPEHELATLLPTGAILIPSTQVNAGTNGISIEVGDASPKDVEILIAMSKGAIFSLLVNDSNDGVTYQKVDTAHISVPNPSVVLTATTEGTSRLSRFKYSGGGKFLRFTITITSTAGTTPSLWITVRVLTSSGVVDDELSLANLTTLCKYSMLRRVTGKPIDELLTLVALSGVNPLAATAEPDAALALLEARDALATLGLSPNDADQLLRGPTGSVSENLEQHTQALLETARRENRSINDESTVTPDQYSVLLTKVLTDLGWDNPLIAEVLSAERLGVSWGDYEAPLDALPAGATLPVSITYDAIGKRLTARQSTRPKALRADLAHILSAATGKLREALHTLGSQAKGRETILKKTQASLRRKTLPTLRTSFETASSSPFEIPSEWRGRFYYERATKELCFVGWMRPEDKTALKLLSPSFAHAIDDLYQQSENYAPTPDETLVVREDEATGLSIEVILLDTDGLQDRCGLIRTSLLREWRSERLKVKLSAALAQDLGCPGEIADELLKVPVAVASTGTPPFTEKTCFDWLAKDDQLLTSDPATKAVRDAFPNTFDAIAQLLILGQLVKKLEMDAAQVSWVRGTWSGLDLKALPTTRTTSSTSEAWASLVALSSLLTLRKHAKVGAAGLAKVLTATQQTGIDYEQLGIALDCSEANLLELGVSAELNINTPAWFRDPLQLRQLVSCLDLSRKLKIPGSVLVNAIFGQMTSRSPGKAEAEVQALRQTALGGVNENNWPEAEKKVLDQIRQRRRDATVDYLVQTQHVRDANDLYGFYLIDPQMGPCMMTSRIVQAISSVQLFIQRCLMQLEPKAPPKSIDKTHWNWMKNYRVWEANRKVLLYPENWIEPELRDDKTPFFDDVVSSLQQGDVTSDKAETAVQTFLEKLTDLSKVEVVATCSSYGDVSSTTGDANCLLITHVFARTLSEPHAYWYRQFRNLDPTDPANSLGIWTSWQAISLDIEGNHLFPFVWQGRLFLFWAIFSQEAKEPTADELKQGKDAPVPPRKFWCLKLAWSEFKSGAWTSRRLAQDDLLSDERLNPLSYERLDTGRFTTSDDFFFRVSVREGGVTINGHYYRDDLSSVYEGYLVPKAVLKSLPFTRLLFDGHKVLRADFIPPTVLSKYNSVIRQYIQTLIVTQTDSQMADVPVDVSQQENMISHFRMNIGQSAGTSLAGKALALNAWTINPVEVFKTLPRSVRLLYSAQTVAAEFSAPSLFANPTPQSGKASPFFVSDRQHQFFVYPSMQQWVPVATESNTGTIRQVPASGTDEIPGQHFYRGIPRLHFYALDWPQAPPLRKTLSDKGVEGLLSFDSQNIFAHPPSQYFQEYSGSPVSNVFTAYPDGDLEFSLNSAASTYNFELFFHVPFAIACSLSKNQRFEEARQWFHYIFDPTDRSDESSSARYWRFRPFRESPGLRIDELVQRLADPKDVSREKREFRSAIAQWKDQPFKPHLVARMRLRSYMYTVVMKYLDNLIAWADQLFRRDTMESLNEATQLYILAAQILGRRPEGIPRRTRPVLKSFSELATSQLDELSNTLVAAENLISNASTGSGSPASGNLPSLYFCVPNNPKLDDYFDRVEDKLFKLRNCMNIDGVVRELALFSPVIDPGLLVKAAAAGLDISTVLADSQAPLPLYRFNVMAQKATELCAEVKSLGAALLSAIEKGDAESLARLRSGHEMHLLQAVRLVKEAQLLEAKANMDALGNNLQSAQTRFAHYVGLMSQLDALSIAKGPVVGPTLQGLAAVALETLSTATAFAQSVASKIDPIANASIEVLKQRMASAAAALAESLPAEGMDTARVPMNPAEKHQLDELKSAHDLQQKAADQRLVAQALAMIPDFTLGAQGFASSPVVQFQLGGTLLSKVANFTASATDSKAGEHTYRATLHSMLAGYQRRADDWLLQAQLASWEIAQIGEQLKASTLRIAIATQELRNHDLQAANALEADEFMRSKFSNTELYAWMSGQLSNLHFQAYQLAYDVTKRAERCFMHELGVDTSFIQFGYWDSLKKGLLAGERLLSDLKRMEIAYLNQNARELEISKHVSLLQLDPLALLQLQETGECEFNVPEVLFDLDFPGHYFRRIKSVSVSVPCVVGSYTSLSGTLTLLSSELRIKSTPVNRDYTDKQNFRASFLPTQSIATSTGQNDSGMFELNFRDERYLPFEGAGVIAKWRLGLPKTFRPFDYSTISDVVLHLKYTARDAGGLLKQSAEDGIAIAVNSIVRANSGFSRLFSLKHEFPTEWYRFSKSTDAADPRSQEFIIGKDRFPFIFSNKDTTLTIASVDLYLLPIADGEQPAFPDTLKLVFPKGTAAPLPLADTSIGSLLGKTFKTTKTTHMTVMNADKDPKWKLTIAGAKNIAKLQSDVEDILMVCHYTV